jgi:tetratricopeptide (TPR) repeat protein
MILNNKDINATIRLEAEYASGMSNYYQSNDSLAKPSLEWVFTNTTTVKAAETRYTLASIYYKDHQFENANQQIKALIKMKPTYNYWVAKGLILQSHVFIAMGDLFQAEQTLQAVIEHYPIQDDGILTEANEFWSELLQLKDQPKEVEPKTEVIIDVNKEEN